METSSTTLNNVNTEKLKHYFNLSTSISKSEILNFTLSTESLSGIAKNENDHIFKKWHVDISDICESYVNLNTSLKCSIYKGIEFSRKILSHFGQTVNITFHHINGDVKSIELFNFGPDGKSISLKIKIVSAPVNTSFVEYDDDLIQLIFEPSADTLFFEFDITPEELIEVTKLSKLGTNPEIKTDYIKIYTEDGYLKVTDNSFDLALHETDKVLEKSIELDKLSWSLIDSDTYKISAHDYGEQKNILVCESTTKQLKTSIVLLSNIDVDVNFDDFDM